MKLKDHSYLTLMNITDKNTVEEAEIRGRILIIDEDPLLAELVHFHFSQAGYGIDTCSSMEEWLTLDTSSYCLVLIDVSVDNGNGIQIIEMMRQNPMTDDIPVIICSKPENTEDIVGGLNAGADDFITRPFAVAELVARSKALLRRFH